ncbi:MAG: hypothetical protein Q8N30_12730, partial [Methylococcales bacterium]|nr:hypothetical protein [Methylococcales bacterium]
AMNTETRLRCYAKKEQSYWVAVCIDLSLAAQADSMKEAIQKLESMIGIEPKTCPLGGRLY